MQKVRIARSDRLGHEGEALLRAIDQPTEFALATYWLGGDAIAAQRSLLRGQIGANRRRMLKFTTRLCASVANARYFFAPASISL